MNVVALEWNMQPKNSSSNYIIIQNNDNYEE